MSPRRTLRLLSLLTDARTCIISGLCLKATTTIDYNDITFNVVRSQVFSALEPALGITLACIPVLRPLFRGKYSKARTTGITGKTSRSVGGTKLTTPRGGFEDLDENTSEHELNGPKSFSQSHVTIQPNDSQPSFNFGFTAPHER